MFPANSFNGKRVALFGLARTGISCAEALRLGGAEVFAWDDSEPAVAQAKTLGIAVTNIHTLDFKTLHALVLSPGVPLTHPEPHWVVIKARAAGIEIIGDTEVFARAVQDSGVKIVAITGTNGKSTTTALIGHVLKQAGLDVDIGGNIGNAVFNLRKPVRDLHYILELSSFQIDLMPGLAPDVGIITNMTADHLDRHGTMENYAAVKARMFGKQHDGQVALVGVDDEWCATIAREIHSGADVRKVSVEHELEDGISAPDGILRDVQDGIVTSSFSLRSMQALKGRHNWQNACMAYGAATALGIQAEAIVAAMTNFPGLAHRMQQIATLGSIAIINDSKATNCDAANKALAAYENIYWIAGGISKSGGFTSMESFHPHIAKAYLIGVAANEIAASLEGRVAYELCETMPRAVQAATRDAVTSGTSDAVVLLSPACSSFDQFKNFEVRGDAFVEIVSRLPGVVMAQGGPV